MAKSAAADTRATRPFSPFEWILALRYIRPRRFVSVIAGFSLLGISLAVATLVVVMAVMNGFRVELLDKILGINGHVIVQPIEKPEQNRAAAIARLKAGIASMDFFSDGTLPTREQRHHRK